MAESYEAEWRLLLGDEGYERLLTVMADEIKRGAWVEETPDQLITRCLVQVANEGMIR
jgi:hypothetical protein